MDCYLVLDALYSISSYISLQFLWSWLDSWTIVPAGTVGTVGTETGTVFQFQYQHESVLGTVFQYQYQLGTKSVRFFSSSTNLVLFFRSGTVFRYRNCRYGFFFNVCSKWSSLLNLIITQLITQLITQF